MIFSNIFYQLLSIIPLSEKLNGNYTWDDAGGCIDRIRSEETQTNPVSTDGHIDHESLLNRHVLVERGLFSVAKLRNWLK